MTAPQIPNTLCHVESEPQRGYLRVTVTGMRTTMEASIAVWREIGRQIAAHAARRALIVSKLSGPMPTPEEQYRIMQALVGQGFEGVRTAFVLEDSVRVAALEHGEIAARELGQETRVFGSEALAEVWLRHGL